MQSRAKEQGCCSVDWKNGQIQFSERFLEVFFNPHKQIRKKLDSWRQQICRVITFF